MQAQAVRRYATAGEILAALLVVAWCAWRWSSGLNPETLWFDDVWVGVLAKQPSLAAALSTPAPTPPGFVFLSWFALRLFGDPEWSLQAVPFAAALATLPLTQLLVRRVTGSRWAGLAGLLMAGADCWVREYSVYVKSYTLDVLAGLLLLLLALHVTRQAADSKGAAAFAAASVLALLFSFFSIFLSAAVLAVLLFRIYRAGRRFAVATLAAAWAAAPALLYVLIIGARSGSGLQGYWNDYFLPSLDPATLMHFAGRFLYAVSGGLPYGQRWLFLAVPAGLVWLHRHTSTRDLAWALTLWLLALPLASALRLYPMGADRIDMFTHPVSLLVFAVGARWAVLSLKSVRLRSYAMAASAVVLLVGTLVGIPRVAYIVDPSHEQVEAALRSIRQDSAVVLPGAEWWVAYYGDWAYETLPASNSAMSHRILFAEPGPTLIAPASPEGMLREIQDHWSAHAGWVVGSRIGDRGVQAVTAVHDMGLLGSVPASALWSVEFHDRSQ